MDKQFLQQEHSERAEEIRNRLQEFQNVWKEGDDFRLFEEMCFCTLTANTSAKMSMNAIDEAGELLVEGSQEDLANTFKGIYRFPNVRSEYIVHNRNYLEEEHDFEIRELMESFDDLHELRDFVVDNIKGLGYKESSHFLRNVGFSGLAILDKHVLRCLEEAGVLENSNPPRTREEYLEKEDLLKGFAEEVGIDVDELDLLLWSVKTGEVLK